MPVKKPSTRFSMPSALSRKRIILITIAIILSGTGIWVWYYWSASVKDNPQLNYILFEKNAEQIQVPAGETLQAGPRDQLKILEISTSIFHNKGVRLTSVGFDVNALLNDKLVIETLLPQNELPDRYRFRIEVKQYNLEIGSIELHVEPMVEDWIGLAEKTIDKNRRIVVLEKALQLHPQDKLIQNRILEEFRSQHKWPQMAKLLEEFAKDQPSEKILNELITVNENLKKPDEVAAALRRLLKLNPQNIEVRTRLARLLEEQKKHSESITEYETLLKQTGPENQLPLYKTLGFLYTETDRIKDAIAVFLKAVELDKNDANLYYNLSNLYAKNNDTEQADLYLTKALEFKADDNESRLKLAESLIKKQKYGEAEKYLTEILDKDPDSLKALLLTARLMDVKKDKPGLKSIYEKILALNPDNGIVLYNLSVLEFEQGDFGKAQTYLKTLLKNNPQDPEAHNLLFEIHKKQKQDDAALKEALFLAELRPAEPSYYRYIFEYLNRNNRHKEMIPIFQKGLIKNPGQKELREYLVLAFLKTGQEIPAMEQIKELIKSQPRNINLWLQLAKLQEKQELLKEALESYQKILDLNPDHTEAEEAYLRLKLELLHQKPE
ncbi:MAG: tetratricopeptide repeat protein [Desulfobacteraceae bacterium]|nr:MAG: tetratricopeptide repeat protein [Desulfobacteraceae bacterium]